MSVRALREYTQRVEASLSPAQRGRVHEREAELLALAPDAWRGILTANLDLALVRQIHRAITGTRETIRRAGLDGQWVLASARPGHLRSQPQALRVGDHVEPAWDHTMLRRRLAKALADAQHLGDPITRAAAMIDAVTRAQPFHGDNERVAMVLAARVLRADGLPALRLGALERDEAFATAVTVATEDRSALVAYLTTAIWDEALAFAATLAPAPATATARWSLRDEHEAATRMRHAARTLAAPELDAILDDVAATVVPALETILGARLGAATRSAPEAYADRVRASAAALDRWHRLCPHTPMRVLRWQVDAATGLELAIAAGIPGHGLTGAAAVHVALEVPSVALRAVAPALLFVPDEPVAARAARIVAWAPRAIEQALVASPLA